MSYQIFGTKKCKETAKAVRWFKERDLRCQFVDLADKGISAGELSSIARAVGLETLLNREGKRYKDRGFAHLEVDLEEELLADPLLMRTPIVRDGTRAAVGFSPELWSSWPGEK